MLLGADPAFAGPENGKAGQHGKSGQQGNGASASSKDQEASEAKGDNGRGSTARELKGLNSAHALMHADPQANSESQVGRVATYRQEAIEAQEAYDAWQIAYNEYLAFEGSYTGPSSSELQTQIDDAKSFNSGIDDQIAALDTASATYADDVSALEAQKIDVGALEAQKLVAVAYEIELDRLATESDRLAGEYETAADEEEDALMAASGGRTLSDAALEELRSLLGL